MDGWDGMDGMDHWTTAPLEHRSESGANKSYEENDFHIDKKKWVTKNYDDLIKNDVRPKNEDDENDERL